MKPLKIIGIFFILFLPHLGNSQDLNKKEIKRIINEISDLIGQKYVLIEKRPAIITAFNNRIQSDSYFKISNPDSLAEKLTRALQLASNDKHLYVRYLADDDKEEELDWEAWEKEERILEKKLNYGFTQAQILEGNVGYLKIAEFMHPHRGMQTAVSAMKFVENTDGLILDLRGNGGGYDGLMEYILNHFFEGEPTHISTTIFSEKDKHPNEDYTSDLVYGKLRANTPLYVLIDSGTGSAAEYFAYTLQSFGKAKIVGQPSAGAAHRNTYFHLPHNFKISISTAAPINPVTKGNWEGTGVQPDFVVKPENTKEKAIEFILTDLNKKK